jgi:hypothetical protein
VSTNLYYASAGDMDPEGRFGDTRNEFVKAPVAPEERKLVTFSTRACPGEPARATCAIDAPLETAMNRAILMA